MLHYLIYPLAIFNQVIMPIGPILFLLYTADIAALVGCHGLHVHLYADDTQVYVHRSQLIDYSPACRPALAMLLAGWRQIGSS